MTCSIDEDKDVLVIGYYRKENKSFIRWEVPDMDQKKPDQLDLILAEIRKTNDLLLKLLAALNPPTE